MTRRVNEPIRLIVDYGAIENMLKGVHAVGEAFAGKVEVKTTGLQISEEAKARFGRETDLLAAKPNSPIAHVYEYTSTHGAANATVPGRLWHIAGRDMGTMTVVFRASTVPVPLDPNEQSPENRSRHIFTWKAPVQEYQRATYQFAGRAQNRITPGASEWLLIYDNQGRPMFRKTWVTYSPYHGNFRRWFNTWWSQEAFVAAQAEAERELERQFVPVVEREVTKYIRQNTRRPIPSKIHGAAPVTFVNNNKPIKGQFDIKPAPVVKRRAVQSIRKIFGRRK